ncbi:MAG TPA: 4-hydroxy-3-methylbut-2-enyl diphosphate reductase [Chthoniobacterales bacterium]|jgi:4-hydroxy-3-methylbut-2-enyl diphosphate reductase
MKIIVAEHFGMCFGVRDAIAQAEKLARQAPLTILGELVHNPIVRERLQATGAVEGSLDQVTAGSESVMITAHGASAARRKIWKAAGFTVFDGTCPLVHHAHRQLQDLVAAGYFPVVIGQPGHVEVRGLTEDFPEAVVLDVLADVAQLPSRRRYGVISQTTQPIEHARALVREIERLNPGAEVLFIDTVCKPTKDRQGALQRLIEQADTIVVVGGRTSNNTRQLVLACRAAGRRALHIERPEELQATDFCDVKIAGLTGGTSTLPETVAAVARRLQEISDAQLKQTTSEES